MKRNGVPAYRLDFAYPRHLVCIEYDGVEAHFTDPAQAERDQERRRWLREQGWTVIVVRAGDFTGARLDRWIDRVRSALLERYTNRRW